jgi:hypothetical protein
VEERTTDRAGRPRLTLVAPAGSAPELDTGLDGRLVAGEVAVVVAEVPGDVLTTAPLTLPLALSVCMARHEVEADTLVEAMRLLRRAVLAVSTLDPESEPVPLGSGDPRTAALNLAQYLHDLFGRAAEAAGVARGAIATSAVAQLEAS